MIQDVVVTLFSAEKNARIDEVVVRKKIAKQLGCAEQDINAFVLKKKSLDARHGKAKFHLRYTVYTGEDVPGESSCTEPLPVYRRGDPKKRVLVVGSGPAGLFAALRLLEAGIAPVVVERGCPVSERKRHVAEISRSHEVNPDSNYCFGEGGAGTFSDGKLYTRSVKRGNPARIHRILNSFGASDSILFDAHPHIGTDMLPGIIQNITAKIVEFGGQVLFNSRCVDFVVEPGSSPSEKPVVRGITIQNVHTGATTELLAQAVVLATGHSAVDIYELVSRISPGALEAKTFAAGLRVEHPRSVIDGIQYHGRERFGNLPAAEYRLTTQVEGRGVYSFCMCPGGLVVPSASGNDGLVVNGMSPSSRAARWSNAAIVVEVRPEDAAASVSTEVPTPDVADALVGLHFRTQLEQMAKRQGRGQAAPAQRLVDFLAGRETQTLPDTSYTPGLVPSRLDLWLPKHIVSRLKAAFVEFDKKMRGFIMDEAVLIAPETRTSTPVRILRDKETTECTCLSGLFPAGEGSGYSGGIVSSAMDGEKVAEAVIRCFSAS